MKRSDFVLAGSGSAILAALPSEARAADAEVRITRLHWAGVELSTEKSQLFIDPVTEFSSDPPIRPSADYSFAIVSHHHSDHFDPINLAQAIGKNGFVGLEAGIARLADHRTLPTQIVSMYEPLFMPRFSADFCAFAVPAVDGMGVPQTSWVIDANGIRMLHLGDTQWHGGFFQIARAYCPFDVLFLPINGFQQVAGRYIKVDQPMSLSPGQAASAVKLFQPRLAIPIHYGEPDPPSYLEAERPLQTFVKLTKDLPTRILSLQQGQSVTLTGRNLIDGSYTVH